MEQCQRCGATDELYKVYYNDSDDTNNMCGECFMLWRVQNDDNTEAEYEKKYAYFSMGFIDPTIEE